MEATRFESAKWVGELGRAQLAFIALDSLVSDKAAVLAHLESAFANQDVFGLMKFFRETGITEAHAVHRRQMVVLAASFFEGATSNFLRASFEAKPERMHDYLGSEESRGSLSLKLVVRSSSRADLLKALSDVAAARVLQMKYEKLLEHLEKLSRPFPAGLREKVEDLLSHRHRIVHEVSDEEVPIERVMGVFNSVRALVIHLEAVAKQDAIPVYSVAEEMLAIGASLKS